MLIDWFTVAAQVVNFLILVALLRIFLYKRIVKAMQDRREKIQKQQDQAESERQHAQSEARRHEDARREFEKQRVELLEKARDEAEETRKKLEEEIREEAQKKRQRFRESLREERDSLVATLRELASRQMFALGRKAFRDLADASLEERMVRVFLERLKQADADQLKELASAAGEQSQKALIRSAFEIPEKLRGQITRTLRERAGDRLEVSYRVDAEGLRGVELSGDGRRMAWSLEAYLDELEERVGAVLDEQRPGRPEEEGGHERSAV